MAQLNRRMAPDVDTVFLMTDIEHGYVSSTMVREIAVLRRRRELDGARGRPPAPARGLSRGRSRSAARVGYNPVLTRRPRFSRSRPIDIIFLIERLEALIANGRRMPMTNSVVVDQVAALDLHRPAARRRARGDRARPSASTRRPTRLVERAQEEAERILARAQEQAAFLIEERELTRAAEIRSPRDHRRGHTRMRTRSDRARTSTRRRVLVRLEGECVKALQSIRRGLTMLDERHPDEDPRPCRPPRTPARPELDPAPERASMLSYNVADLLRAHPAPRASTRSRSTAAHRGGPVALAAPIAGDRAPREHGRGILARGHLATALPRDAAAAACPR